MCIYYIEIAIGSRQGKPYNGSSTYPTIYPHPRRKDMLSPDSERSVESLGEALISYLPG
jgi:hypothetical protein